jgi:lipoprotein NlpI
MLSLAQTALIFLTAGLTIVQAPAQRPQEVFDQALTDFEHGRVVQSAQGFDTLVKMVPSSAPELWQRGIVLYYAGRYKDCRAQFESHRTVNPADVENAAWHFLCVARLESPENARKALLPVGPDSRVPMTQIYEMFQGKRKPEDVLAAAGTRPLGQFYAQLYVGLYHEATGNKRLALQHITNAAADRFAAPGLYMHMVAKIHLGILQLQR